MTGEEWVIQKTGAYLPGAYEEVVEIVDACVLTEKVWGAHCINEYEFSSNILAIGAFS